MTITQFCNNLLGLDEFDTPLREYTESLLRAGERLSVCDFLRERADEMRVKARVLSDLAERLETQIKLEVPEGPGV